MVKVTVSVLAIACPKRMHGCPPGGAGGGGGGGHGGQLGGRAGAGVGGGAPAFGQDGQWLQYATSKEPHTLSMMLASAYFMQPNVLLAYSCTQPVSPGPQLG
jgi:hypothetical protein